MTQLLEGHNGMYHIGDFEMKSLMEHFGEIKDPRTDWLREHRMEDIIFITMAAVMCGAESWYDIENYGKAKELWLKEWLGLPNGIPSHDTFNRFFSALEPEQLERCFLEWVREVAKLTNGEVVSIDGKSIRGTADRNGKGFVHMVSAWASENKLVLGQVKVDDKSNEIMAIPKLLELLVLEGCIVTIDAMGCQTGIAKKIIEKGANYILAVKGNQCRLEEEILATVQAIQPASQSTQTEKGHGRVETRNCFVYDDLSLVKSSGRWSGLKSVIRVESSRQIKASRKNETENRLYIGSFIVDAKDMGKHIRAHWQIENCLHWSLDVSFNEDSCRKKAGFAAQNFSMINRIALNLAKNDKSKKRSIKGKRLDAGWNNDYLLHLLKN
jgi:predicted transposase YbfD/YdcC